MIKRKSILKSIVSSIFQYKIGWMITAIFFIGFLYLGLHIYQDYGVSYDEEGQMVVGEYFYNAAFAGDTQLNPGEENYYYFDSSFDMILHAATMNMIRMKQILTRHMLVFLCFYLSTIFFFFLALYIFKDWKLSIIACMFLVAHPRIFADSFYNSKDIPFLSFFILASLTLFLFIRKPNWLTGFIHAVTSAYLTSIRLPGLILPLITIGFFVFLLMGNKFPKRIFFIIGILCFYSIMTLVLIIFFIPAFWHNPFEGLFNAFSLVKNYPWGGHVLYRGQFIPATGLPWHYLPTWIGITTPIGILLLFGLGLVMMIRSWFKSGKEIFAEERLQEIYLILWFSIPILAVIAFRSTIYDGWRHMFFIYPAMVLIAIKGMNGLSEMTRLKNFPLPQYSAVIFFVCAITLFRPVNFMMMNHPYEYVYFNWFAGQNLGQIKSEYDLDYWGISYLNGLEYIVRSDPSDTIQIKTANPAGELNAYLLTRKNRNRIQFTNDIRQADYFVTNYRWHPQAYSEFSNEVYAINVDGGKILSVYKLREAPK